MFPKYFPSYGVKVPSEYERTENLASPLEHVKRNLVDLVKRLDEAEIFLSASRSYLAASTERLEIAKRNMCVSEVDIHTATDCVVQTERKLQTMHSELHSLYQNIFCKNSCYGNQDNESGLNSEEIHASAAIPMYAANVLGRYADDMSIDLHKYIAKCYEYKRSNYIILQPVHVPFRSQNDTVQHSVSDFRSCQSRFTENHSTVKADNARYTSSENSGNAYQIYKESELQCENPDERKLWVSVKYTMNGLNSSNAQSETVNERLPTDHVLFSFNRKSSSSRTDSITPASANTGFDSQSGESCEDYHSIISNFPINPKLYEDSHEQTCFSSSSNTQTSSEEDDSNFPRFARFLEIPPSKKKDLNQRISRQLSGQQSRETQTKHKSYDGFCYETKESNITQGDTVKMSQIAASLPATHSDNSFLLRKPERRLKAKYEQSFKNAAESDEILVNRNRPKPYKKKGDNLSTPTKCRRTCKTGGRKDQSSNHEGQSNQFANEISSSVSSGATPLNVSQRTDNEYIDNLLQTFEIDTMMKDEMANNSALNASGDTSFSEDAVPNFWWQKNQSENESETSKDAFKESRSKFLQIENANAKFLRNLSAALISNATRKCFPEMERNSLSDREYSQRNNSASNRFSSDVSLRNTEALNNDVDNKDFETSPFDISGNTTSFDPNVELASSENRAIYLSNVSPSTSTVVRFVYKKKPYSPNQIKIPRSNRPVKFKESKNLPASNSVSNENISYITSRDGNSSIVHRRNSDSAFQKAPDNCIPNDSHSEPNKSQFSSRKSFYPCDKGTIVPESGFPKLYSALNSSGLVDARSECSLVYDFDFGTKGANLNYEDISSTATGSKRSHNDLSSFCTDMTSNDASSNYSHLPSTETGSTRELSDTSSTPFDSQNETTRLLHENSSSVSSPLNSADWSPKRNFEDPQESFVTVSTPLPYISPNENLPSPTSSSDNCSFENSP